VADRLVLVDAANVVGSRPDGWWRDRPGAARRLVEQLRAAVADGRLPGPVTVVLEGAARRGVGEGDGAVTVDHAPRSGDDRLVEITGTSDLPVTLVTADRGLRQRVDGGRVTCVGPRWLWRHLEPDA
jgi:hypothetical protein